MTPADAQRLFAGLRAIIEPCAAQLCCITDTAEDYTLETSAAVYRGRPLFFGAVRIARRYVSYHLMPVYMVPALLDGLPEGLRARMHGKSCFNFTSYDAAQAEELAALTTRALALYAARGWLDDG